MAQNHQIRMSLMFDANTSKAKASLKDLQNSLNELTTKVSAGDFPMTNQIKEAYVATEKLKQALNSSVNMQTGKFDISKFNMQLKQSGLSVAQLGQKMAAAGTTGAQAFTQLATTIANAEIPTKRMSALAEKLARGFQDTARWQLQSSVLHAFTGALQSAYGYAKDLNRSLNDIRIVTGENIDFMERYATSANKAARALSASTNEYAKASLIFYQQGLDDAEVAKRTAATIKMANVTGESAQDISSYMTAIWNNFEDGTKTLEYYADAITALGAATASSTEEIAGGMQQFASVAETVGLSYEYAASALATVVAATRQSEETVGTSFKTIFARLSSLQLGEELEDGTTLTKYSAALAKVGIDIKDGNGQLKAMDQILDELGAKWNNISREQQNALAYTVAGTRQYNNFISLLDNYETFKINVDLAIDSEGTLNRQQEIYAESWEAAADRAKTAAESIYEKLLDDDFFIDMLNGLEKFLIGLDGFIDALGGLPGVLSLISTLMLRIFSVQASEAVRNMSMTIRDFIGVGAKEVHATKGEVLSQAKKVLGNARQDVGTNMALDAELQGLEAKIELEQQYLKYQDELTESQKQEYQMQMNLLDVLRQQSKEKAAQLEKAKEQMAQASEDAISSYKPVETEARQKKAAEALDTQVSIASNAEEQMAWTDMLEGEMALKLRKAKLNRSRAQNEFDKQYADAAHKSFSEEDRRYHSTDSETEAQFQNAQDVLALMDSEIDEMEAEIARLQAARKGYEAEANQAALKISELQENGFSAMDPAAAKIELDKYLNYSSGQADVQQTQLLQLIEEYRKANTLNVESKEYGEAIKKLNEQLDLFKSEYEQELDQSVIEVVESIENELVKGQSERQSADELVQSASNAHEEASKKYKRKNATEIRAEMRENAGVDFSDAAVGKLDGALTNMRKSAREAEKSMADVGKTGKQAMEDVKNAAEGNLPDCASSFVNLTTAISSLTTVFTSFKNIFDIWNNSDLSFSEKLLKTFTALPTVIGSAAFAFQTLQKVQVKDSLAAIANAIAHKADARAKQANAQASDQAEKETAELTGETNKNTASEMLNNATKKKGGLKSSFKNMGNAFKTNAKDFGTTFKAGAKGWGGKGAAMASSAGGSGAGAGAGASGAASIGSSLGAIASVALPIIAGIALLAGGIALTVKGFKKAEEHAKKAEASAAQFKTAAAEAKQSYEDTVSTISSYEDALEGMKELTKGTDEWKKSMLEANEQAFELISKYDSLTGKYHFEDGQVVFDEGALEDLERERLDNAANAQAASFAADNTARKARMESDKTNMARDLVSGAGIMNSLGNGLAATALGAGSGALIGAGLGAAGMGVGAIPGAIVGGIAGLTAGVVATIADVTSTDSEVAAIEELQRLYEENPSIFESEDILRSALEGNTVITDPILIDSLVKNRDALEETVSALVANTAQIEAQTEAMVNAANQDNEDYTSSEWQDALDNYGRKALDDENSEKRKAVDAEIKQLWKGGNEDFWDKYLEEMYGDDADQYQIKNMGGGAVTLQKKNEDGTWDTIGEKNGLDEKVAEEQLREKMVVELSSDEIAAETQELNKIRSDLAQSGIKESEVLIDAATQFRDKGTVDLSRYTGQQLEAIGKNVNNITDATLREATKTALANAQLSWNTILEDYSSNTRQAISRLETQSIELDVEFSRESLINYGNLLEKFTIATGNEDAANAFDKKIGDIIAANPDQAADILKALNEVDWTNPLAGAQEFEYKMSELNIAVDLTNLALNEWGDTIATIDFDKQINQLASLNKLAQALQAGFDKLSKPGSIISPEDYEKYKELGLIDSSNVMLTATGDYMITDAIDALSANTLIADEAKRKLEINKNEYDKFEQGVATEAWYQIASTSGAPQNFDDMKAYYSSLLENEDALEASGYSKEWIQSQLDMWDESTTMRAAPEALAQFMDASKWESDLSKSAAKKIEKSVIEQKPYALSIAEQQAQSTAIGGEALSKLLTNFVKSAEGTINTDAGEQWITTDQTLADLRSQLAVAYENNVDPELISDIEAAIEYVEQYNNASNTMAEAGVTFYKDLSDISPDDPAKLNEYANKLEAEQEERKKQMLPLEQSLATSIYSIQELDRLYEEGYFLNDEVYNARREMLQTTVEAAKKDLSLIEDYNAQIQKISKKLEKISGKTDVQAALGNSETMLSLWASENSAIGTQIGKARQAKITAKGKLDGAAINLREELRKAGVDASQWASIQKEYGVNGEITNWDSILSQLYDLNSNFATDENFKKLFEDAKAYYVDAANTYTDMVTQEEDLREQQIENLIRRGDLLRQVHEAVQDEIDAATNSLSHFEAVINTLGKNVLGLGSEEMQRINNAQDLAANANAANAKESYDDEIEQLNYLKTQLYETEGLTTQQRTALQQAIAEQEKNVQAALDNMNSSWSNALSQAAESFQNNVELTLQDFETSISGLAGSLEAMGTTFAQQSELSEQYLEDYEKVYHLNKLSRDLQKSIDETSSIQGKQALNDLQQELVAMQAEGAEVSEYDLEYMQKKYELRLAEIALEEAQNAKSQVRLQKMANGSWGYVYTQNENAVAEAQSAYEEKLFNLQDYNTTYLNSVSEQIINTQKDFQSAIQEIYTSGLSPEEQQKRIDEVTAFYESKLGFLTSEMDAVLANNEGLQGMVTNFSDTILGAMYPAEYDEADDIFTRWKEAIGDENGGLFSELEQVANNYSTTINSIFNTLGTSIDGWLESMISETRAAAIEMNDIITDVQTGNVLNGALGITGTRGHTIDLILEGQGKKGLDVWDRNALETMSNDALQRTYNQAAAMGMVKDVGMHGWYSQQGGFTRDEVIEMLRATAPSGYLDGYGDLSQLTDEQLKSLVSQATGFGWLDRSVLETIMQGNWAAFSTGGYTGEWGSNGKLAILHEKELILNAQDTQNLLQTMQVMDQMLRNIELQAAAAAFDHALSATLPKSGSGDTLQQKVTIHAEFPNATNHSEIEQAFDTLINRASQFANRNR